MKKKPIDIRKTLSMNIKKHRELLNISQEKLSEKAGISSNMVRDIEGCRTWVSDNTLKNIAAALGTDIYRLFMPENISEAENYRTVLFDLTKTFKKLRTDFDLSLENALKLWSIKEKNSHPNP
ncbi:MAG: helix-turn-helix domain-containing protein [Treponema sp.]|jgi:transcriptional regulator with XRE-family HTH domain|nr:helix-turn-helix domain-containing protein [Treponema sp.]